MVLLILDKALCLHFIKIQAKLNIILHQKHIEVITYLCFLNLLNISLTAWGPTVKDI